MSSHFELHANESKSDEDLRKSTSPLSFSIKKESQEDAVATGAVEVTTVPSPKGVSGKSIFHFLQILFCIFVNSFLFF